MKFMVLNVKMKPKAIHSYLGGRAYSFNLRIVRAKFNLRLHVLVIVNNFTPLFDHFKTKGFNVNFTYKFLRSIQ